MKFELIRSNKMDMRTAFKAFYINKFFNMWMKKFKFGQLDYQEIFYIMKKYWFEGTIACSERLNPPEVAEMLPKCVFTPWVLSGVYNCYDFPTSARCINVRAVSYISNKVLEIDKEIVIGWCQPNHKGVYSSIDAKIHQLVDLEMIIRVCTKNQKSPWIIAFSPEDEKAVKQLIEDMDGDDPVLTTMLKDLKNTKALTSGAPFIVDKLEAQRQKVEDDIKTMLGMSNVGIAQKKEHFTDDEVQSNNAEIQESNDDYLDEIKAFLERCNKTFGTSYSVELAHENQLEYNEDVEIEDEEVMEDE